MCSSDLDTPKGEVGERAIVGCITREKSKQDLEKTFRDSEKRVIDSISCDHEHLGTGLSTALVCVSACGSQPPPDPNGVLNVHFPPTPRVSRQPRQFASTPSEPTLTPVFRFRFAEP